MMIVMVFQISSTHLFLIQMNQLTVMQMVLEITRMLSHSILTKPRIRTTMELGTIQINVQMVKSRTMDLLDAVK